MKSVGLFVCLVACICTAAFAKTQPGLQAATVISQEIQAHNGGTAVMPMGTMFVGVPITRRSNIVVVETLGQRLTWSEYGKTPIVLPVNEVIGYYRDGDWYVVPDSKGKKHKFSAIHIETIAPHGAN